MGLGYRDLSRPNPGLVMTSITPFGQTGPYARYKATDLIGMAMGGIMYISGDADRPPVRGQLSSGVEPRCPSGRCRGYERLLLS